MTIQVDPEENEIRALLQMVDLRGRRVLEIGCGDGRLTRRYAAQAAHVTAIDAYEDGIKQARAALPVAMRDHVHFEHRSIDDFTPTAGPGAFDTAIFAWSL